MKKFLIRTLHNWARFFQVQLFLSLVSLPITISWGLPFSVMTVVGNFLFGPFLAAFLFIASLIFFSELLNIPNSWLIFVLEKITHIWSYVLGFGQKSWLIGFYKPSLLILICSTVCAFIILQHKKLGKLYPSIACLLGIFLSTTGYLYLTRPKLSLLHIPCGRNEITVSIFNNRLIIKDNSAFAKKVSPESWAQFTLLPELAQKTGRTVIHCIHVTNPNSLTFQMLTALCRHGHVKKIELPFFDSDLTPHGWRTYFELLKITKETGTLIERISLPE